MNPILATIVLAVAGGVGLAVQAPTNAMLSRPAGSAANAALVSFIVGSVALGLFCLVARARPDAAALKALPWYAWAGGVYGAFFVAVAAFAAPRIGVGAMLTAVVAGQLATGIVLDHLGALGLERHPASVARVAGLALVIAGAFLVERG
jgi:transporter family-2 protein